MSSPLYPIPKTFLRHLCVLYKNPEETAIPVEAFCHHALSTGGRLLWTLKSPVPSLDVRAPDQVATADPRQWFSADGLDFGPLDERIEAARKTGHPSVHLVTDLAWLLETDYPERRLFEWEDGVNRRVEAADLHVLCLYETPRFSRSFLPYILFLHPFLWQGGECHVNPHYLPSKWHTLFPMPKNLWLSPAQLPTPIPDGEPRPSLVDCSRVRAYLGHLANDLNNMLNILALKLDFMAESAELSESLRQEVRELQAVRERMGREVSNLQKRFREDSEQISKDMGLSRNPAYPYWKPVDGFASSSMDAAPQSQGPFTLLLVDDEPSVLKLTERILTREGYRVRAFPGAREALDALARTPFSFDALITDVVMPRMNGFELFLRLQETRPHLPTLFMSGYTANVFDEQGSLPPNSRFLPKPFLPQELVQAIRGILKNR